MTAWSSVDQKIKGRQNSTEMMSIDGHERRIFLTQNFRELLLHVFKKVIWAVYESSSRIVADVLSDVS